jgi:hypothetical protein
MTHMTITTIMPNLIALAAIVIVIVAIAGVVDGCKNQRYNFATRQYQLTHYSREIMRWLPMIVILSLSILPMIWISGIIHHLTTEINQKMIDVIPLVKI